MRTGRLVPCRREKEVVTKGKGKAVVLVCIRGVWVCCMYFGKEVCNECEWLLVRSEKDVSNLSNCGISCLSVSV